MSINPITKTIQIDSERTITLETGKLAKQADGSVVIRQGNCVLLATVVSPTEIREGTDFLPLSVDYQEKYASVGRFPGGFFKREARLSEYEILICRLIDRALRPLFPDDYRAAVQVMISLISADETIMPDTLAGLAASAALTITDIPFNGPISEVRVARIDGNFVINPYIEDLANADIDILVAGTSENVIMVEGEMKEISEQEMLDAISVGHEEVKKHCKAQLEFAAAVGVKEKREYDHVPKDEDLKADVKAKTYDKVYAVAKGAYDKAKRKEEFTAIRDEYMEQFSEEELEEKTFLIKKYYHDVEKEAIRRMILDEKTRLDGRELSEVRPIWCEVDYLPSPHGSAVFTRGETQSLTTVTLGSKLDEQIIDGAMISGTNRFLLHYNFPPFSTGEARPVRGVGRREVGHGNLAMRSLKQVLPADADNPYTVRIVSDVLESNGSSSMATVCAGSLALMDAGIQIKGQVSGIAMGLITDGKDFAVLSDILGDEDHLGDMDFKVTGTEKGICACQMDLKVDGLPAEIMMKALNQAKEGRLHIMGEMNKVLSNPNSEPKDHAPRIVEMRIPSEYIGAVIGPGGKIIQEMQRESGANISIDEVDNEGVVQISSKDKVSIDKVINQIKSIVAVPEVGEIYEGKVKNITSFGAFIEILPGKDGLLHISEIDHKRIENVEDVLKEGDIVEVKLIDVDSKTGKLRLSRKVLIPKPPKEPVA